MPSEATPSSPSTVFDSVPSDTGPNASLSESASHLLMKSSCQRLPWRAGPLSSSSGPPAESRFASNPCTSCSVAGSGKGEAFDRNLALSGTICGSAADGELSSSGGGISGSPSGASDCNLARMAASRLATPGDVSACEGRAAACGSSFEDGSRFASNGMEDVCCLLDASEQAGPAGVAGDSGCGGGHG
mmetsp:Transcript_51297/g.158974  ORF Transcript_51297/g.158974 Transcript_51297/m.158974 type:complete len:188 (+) Transcript_51297:523-1086(+)